MSRRRTALVALTAAVAASLGTLSAISPAQAAPGDSSCDTSDPTSTGDCITDSQIYKIPTKSITNYRVNGELRTDYESFEVPAIRPLSYVEAWTGPDEEYTRIPIEHPCTFVQTYSGGRMFEYPAKDQFRYNAIPKAPRANYITDGSNPPASGSFHRLQMDRGIGSLEAPSQEVNSDAYGGTYRSRLNLSYERVYAHRGDEAGHWWAYQCIYDDYNGLTDYNDVPGWLQTKLTELHLQLGPGYDSAANVPLTPYQNLWRYWQDGQEAPPTVEPPVLPPDDYAELAVPDLDLDFAPVRSKTQVRFPTWLWVENEVSGYPIRIQANGDTIVAEPQPLEVEGLPDGSDEELACTGGGEVWTGDRDAETDCSVQFGQGTPEGEKLKLTFTQRWKITVNGDPIGDEVERTAAYNFRVRSSQSAGGN